MLITTATDLTQFAGRRVIINHVRQAVITDIRHGNTSPFEGLRGGFGGMCIEEPHGTCRGGSTAFWWPYDTTDLTLTGA